MKCFHLDFNWNSRTNVVSFMLISTQIISEWNSKHFWKIISKCSNQNKMQTQLWWDPQSCWSEIVFVAKSDRSYAIVMRIIVLFFFGRSLGTIANVSHASSVVRSSFSAHYLSFQVSFSVNECVDGDDLIIGGCSADIRCIAHMDMHNAHSKANALTIVVGNIGRSARKFE